MITCKKGTCITVAFLQTLLTLVIKGLRSIPLVVGYPGLVRTIHRQLQVVGSQSVKVSIMI